MTDPGFQIEPFRPGDGRALEALHRRAILALAGGHYTAEECASWAHGLRARRYVEMAAGAETFVVARMAHGPVGGFCSFTMREADAGEICGLYVDPLFQRRGIGRALIAHGEGVLFDAGARTITIGSSLAALPFYQSHGYSTAERKRWKTRGGLEIATARVVKRLGDDRL